MFFSQPKFGIKKKYIMQRALKKKVAVSTDPVNKIDFSYHIVYERNFQFTHKNKLKKIYLWQEYILIVVFLCHT